MHSPCISQVGLFLKNDWLYQNRSAENNETVAYEYGAEIGLGSPLAVSHVRVALETAMLSLFPNLFNICGGRGQNTWCIERRMAGRVSLT